MDDYLPSLAFTVLEEPRVTGDECSGRCERVAGGAANAILHVLCPWLTFTSCSLFCETTN